MEDVAASVAPLVKNALHRFQRERRGRLGLQRGHNSTNSLEIALQNLRYDHLLDEGQHQDGHFVLLARSNVRQSMGANANRINRRKIHPNRILDRVRRGILHQRVDSLVAVQEERDELVLPRRVEPDVGRRIQAQEGQRVGGELGLDLDLAG